MTRWHRILEGRDVVCMASGPSLTMEDVELVRKWRVNTGGRVIVTNTTFRCALWADILFAMDRRWWAVYLDEARRDFQGALATSSGSMCRQGWKTVQSELRKFKPFCNSGTAAISLALRAGATRVIMLGYDCQRTGGAVHHHGNHPKPLGNAGSLLKWPAYFRMLKASFPKASIVNASRETSLDMFIKMPLELALRTQEEKAA